MSPHGVTSKRRLNQTKHSAPWQKVLKVTNLVYLRTRRSEMGLSLFHYNKKKVVKNRSDHLHTDCFFSPIDWTNSDLHAVKGCLFPSSFQRFTQHPLPETMIKGRNREGKQNLDPAPPLTSGISVFVLSGKIGLKYKWSKRYWWYQIYELVFG